MKFNSNVPAIFIQIRMGKNVKPDLQSNPKTKTIKANKPKNKEMFTELKTHQENKINVARIKSDLHIKSEMAEEDNDVSCDDPARLVENDNNVEEICAMVHQLLSKNVTQFIILEN